MDKTAVITILLTTYSTILPLLLGYIIKTLTKIRDDKAEGHAHLIAHVDEFTSKVDELKDRVENMSYKIDMDEAMTSRYRIIRAADELTNGMELSPEHLEQLGEDIEIYRSFCAHHKNYKNHKGQNSMKLVEEYEKKLRVEQIKAI